MKVTAILLCCAAVVPRAAAAQEWSQPVRGSWVRAGDRPQPGDMTLAGGGAGCEIVVAADEHTAVAQAAAFLAGDIEKISGYRPPIVARPSGSRVVVRLATRPDGRWEAYAIRTADNEVSLIGSNFRGTAFAAYTLSERLGIDPLYIWTGYTPERHTTLILKQTNYRADPPTFKYRGFFHDDEDILPRPFDENGYPLQTGTVPRVWYERFFETALRLRMNMVAPYVRVQRPYDIQKTASDWGLVYTSHHYDALVSNPWGFSRFGLAAERHAGTGVGLVHQPRRAVELLARRRAREPRPRRVLARRPARHPGSLVHVSRRPLRRREKQGIPRGARCAGRHDEAPAAAGQECRFFISRSTPKCCRSI